MIWQNFSWFSSWHYENSNNTSFKKNIFLLLLTLKSTIISICSTIYLKFLFKILWENGKKKTLKIINLYLSTKNYLLCNDCIQWARYNHWYGESQTIRCPPHFCRKVLAATLRFNRISHDSNFWDQLKSKIQKFVLQFLIFWFCRPRARSFETTELFNLKLQKIATFLIKNAKMVWMFLDEKEYFLK